MNRTSHQHNPLLSLEDVSVFVRGNCVLEGIDWQIGFGEQWAILGPNGSGKTTLVKAIAGKLPYAAGKIRYNYGDDEKRLANPNRVKIGFVSAEQHRQVFEKEAFIEDIRHFTGDENRFLCVEEFLLDQPPGDEHPAVAGLSALQHMGQDLGISKLFQKRVSSLTTGEISKILIAKALLDQPRLLILDEPFNGIDPQSWGGVAQLIGKLIRSGLQVILITHSIDQIIPEISHVLLLTTDGIETRGIRNKVIESESLKKVYKIAHDPLSQSKQVNSKKAGSSISIKWDVGWDADKGAALVEMRKVSVIYGQNIVLKNISWTVKHGQNWMIYGPDGAGKTSLLKLITGENLQAYANDIYLFGVKKGSGESVWEIKQKIGWISPDMLSKYPKNIVGVEVVCSGFFDSIGLFRTATNAQKERAGALLVELGIDHLAQELYGMLSQGQKQMLLIARAIVKSPILLLLDEPCEGLDFANRRKVIEIIEYIGSQTDSCVVCATSDPNDNYFCMTHHLHINRGVRTKTTISPKPISQ
jgi:molybdate transport system ATP-binding protein